MARLTLSISISLLLLTVATATDCPSATYKLTLKSLFSTENFPSAPDNAHLSPLTAFTHSRRFSSLVRYGYATEGVKNVAETGDNTQLLKELRAAAAQPFIKTVATTDGPIGGGEEVTVELMVDCTKTFVSFLSMVAPSPDWIVALANMDLREGGRFVDRKAGNLMVYDAGTDSGTTLLAEDMETSPRENIAPLLGEPFNGMPAAEYVIEKVMEGCKKVMYELTVTNLWTAERFGEVPENAALSPLTAFSHNRRFSGLVLYGYASPGVQSIAETGDNSVMLEELASDDAKPFVKSVATTDGPALAGESFSVKLEVDCMATFVSFLTMVAPSPDWMVAGANIDMMEDGRFARKKNGVLRVYDAGTDSGTTLTAEDEPTSPRENIAMLRGAPFNGRHVAWYVLKKMRN